MSEEALHITSQNQPFCNQSENWEGCCKGEAISHFGAGFRQGQEEVIVLHGFEYALNHRVLEIAGRIKCSDFAGKVLPDPEVSRAPADKLVWADKTRLDSPDSLLTRLLCPQQMHLDAA